MRHHGRGGKVSAAAFIIGAAAGALAAEALAISMYPQVKRSMLRKGVQALRFAKNLGERFL